MYIIEYRDPIFIGHKTNSGVLLAQEIQGFFLNHVLSDRGFGLSLPLLMASLNAWPRPKPRLACENLLRRKEQARET